MNQNNTTAKAIICFILGWFILCGCAVAYWLFAHDPVLSQHIEDSGIIIGIIAFFLGGGSIAIGVKLMTGYTGWPWS